MEGHRGRAFLFPVCRNTLTIGLIAVLAVGVTPALAALPSDEPSTALAASRWGPRVRLDRHDRERRSHLPPGPGIRRGIYQHDVVLVRAGSRWVTMIDANSFVSSDGSTDYLAGLFVYAQTDGGLDPVACNGFPATVFIPAESGTTYLIMVGGLTAAGFPDDDPGLLDRGGTFDLTIEPIRADPSRPLPRCRHIRRSVPDRGMRRRRRHRVVQRRGTAKTFFTATGPRAFTFQISTDDVPDGWWSDRQGQLPPDLPRLLRWDCVGNQRSIKVVVDGGAPPSRRRQARLRTGRGAGLEAGPHPIFHEGFDLCALLRGE